MEYPKLKSKGTFHLISHSRTRRAGEFLGKVSQCRLVCVMQAIRISALNVITNYKLPPYLFWMEPWSAVPCWTDGAEVCKNI